MNIDYPLRFNARGRTASTDFEDHVRDMIEQLLFTRPGERVNRPEFGSGLMHAAFDPNTPEVATALDFSLRAALQTYLGDIIVVHELAVAADDATLSVQLQYSIRQTGQRCEAEFSAEVPA